MYIVTVMSHDINLLIAYLIQHFWVNPDNFPASF
jgi:hypothetical protein